MSKNQNDYIEQPVRVTNGHNTWTHGLSKLTEQLHVCIFTQIIL